MKSLTIRTLLTMLILAMFCNVTVQNIQAEEQTESPEIVNDNPENPEGGDANANGEESKEKKDEDFGPVFTIELPRKLKMEFIWVEKGKFNMCVRDKDSEPDEKPHEVTFANNFYIGKTEVTQAQWLTLMPKHYFGFDVLEYPVTRVTWYMAMQFCQKLNAKKLAPEGWIFILPSETQWEYAARGGVKAKEKPTLYSGSAKIDEVAWHEKNGKKRPHKVARKKPNELGIYDMTGNVQEWCQDDWDADILKTPVDLVRPFNDNSKARRNIRGGGWRSYPEKSRVSYRTNNDPEYRSGDLGFRVVLMKDPNYKPKEEKQGEGNGENPEQ